MCPPAHPVLKIRWPNTLAGGGRNSTLQYADQVEDHLALQDEDPGWGLQVGLQVCRMVSRSGSAVVSAGSTSSLSPVEPSPSMAGGGPSGRGLLRDAGLAADDEVESVSKHGRSGEGKGARRGEAHRRACRARSRSFAAARPSAELGHAMQQRPQHQVPHRTSCPAPGQHWQSRRG